MNLLFLSLIGLPALASDVTSTVGLSTQVEGTVHVVAAESEASAALAPFHELHLGDRILLAPEATLEVVYFDTSRRETWSGPADLVVGVGSGEMRSGSAPKVQQLDVSLCEQLQTLPLLIRRAERGRLDKGRMRGGEEGPDPRSLLDAEELAAVELARKRFEGLREGYPHQDVLPFIYYATVLQNHGLEGEAAEVLREAQIRCPFCDIPPLSAGP